MIVKASVVIPFGADQESRRQPFVAAVHKDDQIAEMQVVFEPKNTTPASLQQLPVGSDFYTTSLLRYGAVIFRLYCPSTFVPTIVPLEALTVEEHINSNFYYFGRLFYLNSTGFTGNQVVSLGRFEDEVITEELTFNASDIADLTYWHDARSVAVLYKSNFVNKLGAMIPPPVYKGEGRYVLSQPGYGTLVVSYTTSYYKYKVYHQGGVGSAVISGARTVFAGESGSNVVIIPRDYEMPAFPILCLYDSYATLLRARRTPCEFNFGVHFSADAEDLGVFTGGPKVDQGDCVVRYASEADASQYVDVKYFKEYEFIDSAGRKLTLRFPNCT